MNDLVVRNGKIVVAGRTLQPKKFPFDDFVLTRLLPDGSLDRSFGGDGMMTADFGDADAGETVAIQRDGKLVVAGVVGKYADRLGVARFLPGT